jgi:glycosyltransferase involved in cell wall biosynthesis
MYEEVQPDVIFVERWRALQYAPEDAAVPVVCDPTDSMTLYNRRLMKAGAWWERLLGWEEYRKFLLHEGKLARRADVSVFCSRVDMECVKEQAPEVQCELVPNGVDCRRYFFKDQSEEETDTVIFTGGFQYPPNRHAVAFFMEKIFPLVQRAVPGVKFLAVGNAAGHKLRSFRGREGFEAIDFVPDLRPYLAKATVAVAPLTVGSGVSIKVLEAFATGTAMVATPMPCGDLPVRNGEHLLIAEDVEGFAEHVVRLLRDAELRRRIAARARRLAEEQYDWEIVSGKLERLIEEAVERKAGSRPSQMIAIA